MLRKWYGLVLLFTTFIVGWGGTIIPPIIRTSDYPWAGEMASNLEHTAAFYCACTPFLAFWCLAEGK